ncbi:MAG: mandelate racemase/muconate lactonizing enzyme family protein, partial [Firmicutes bacterium]|nr:mandelate racemase/muconate lactonizing enzyme family protein [Bacillota bacterium]
LAELKDSCRQAVEEGYTCVKLDFLNYDENGVRPTRGMREQLLEPKMLDLFQKRIEACRQAIGPDVQLIVENHSRLDSAGAVQIAQIAKNYDILYFEEPNTPSAFTAEYLKEKIDIPLAAGERIYTRWQYIPYLENRTLRVIQPDISNCGGYTETKKVCDMAHAYDVGVQIHVCGSPLSTHIALQLEAVIPNFAIHEHHSLLRSIDKPITKYNWQPQNGQLPVPTEPGIGNELTEDAWKYADAKTTIQ